MTISPTPVELEITLRNVQPGERVREYAIDKLRELAQSLPNLRSAIVEVTHEGTRAAEHRYVVQSTLSANGTVLRVEERGPDPLTAIDRARDLLFRKIQEWKGRVYFRKRQEGAQYKASVEAAGAALPPEEKTDLIVRVKSHETKPLFPEDAVEQMELLGHDFFFFLNAETGQHNVLYRRKEGGYGLICPAFNGASAP